MFRRAESVCATKRKTRRDLSREKREVMVYVGGVVGGLRIGKRGSVLQVPKSARLP